MSDKARELIDQIEERPVEGDLEWLAKGNNHVLNNESFLVVYLLKRVRELEEHLKQQ